jgi:hypothetical protein
MDNLPPDGLTILDEKRGDSDSRLGWHGRLSGCFAYASLACSLLLWVAFALYCLQSARHFSVPGWKWFDSLPGWTWPRYSHYFWQSSQLFFIPAPKCGE